MYDLDYLLKDAGLVGSSAAGEVEEAAAVINVGRDRMEGKLVIDVSEIEIASNNEKYRLKLQGSPAHDFSEQVEDLAILELGAKEVLGGDQDSDIGRYVVPFSNQKGLYAFPYLRVYCEVSGSVETGINYSAYVTREVTDRNYTCQTTTTSTTTTTTSTTTTTT